MDLDSPEILAACTQLGWKGGLREIQKEILGLVFEGHDVVTVIPTSAGKSGIYQVPALVRPGLVIVISPLIALMIDQVDSLKAHGVAAEALHSHCSSAQKKRILDDIKANRLQLLYVSPERLSGMEDTFFEGVRIQMFAIDEAHCISEWGHDFRPPYRRLGATIRRFGRFQVLALTATATREVAADIAHVLQIDESGTGRVMRYSPDRVNITYYVVGRKVEICRLVGWAGTPAIVYGSTRRNVELAAEDLRRGGFRCEHYHAGMDKLERMRVQHSFQAGEIDVIAATCAFGLGIDHAGIRGVIHLEMPTSLEAYAQESGRAGRDGSPSYSVCRATVDALDVARNLSLITWPLPDQVSEFWESLKRMFKDGTGEHAGRRIIHTTIEKLAALVGVNSLFATSALRILEDYQNIRRIAWHDLPMTVVINHEKAALLRGPRQRKLIAALSEHATVGGRVTGSVGFFKDVIGLEKRDATSLRDAGALKVDWVERGQVIEALHDGDALLDSQQLLAVRARALSRIESARGFLSCSSCRRNYMLSYFGDFSGGHPAGECCDRCRRKTNPQAPAAVARDGAAGRKDTPRFVAKAWLANRDLPEDLLERARALISSLHVQTLAQVLEVDLVGAGSIDGADKLAARSVLYGGLVSEEQRLVAAVLIIQHWEGLPESARGVLQVPSCPT